MVTDLSIILMAVTLVVTFGVPIGLTIYLAVKKKASLLVVLVGALTFLVVQGLIRIPLLNLFSTSPVYERLLLTPVLLALFLGLTAGLVEEGGRWISMRFLVRPRMNIKNAVAFGVGHGGFEAIFLVGLAYITNLISSLAINNGTFETTLAPQLGATAETMKSLLIETPPYHFGLSGVERVFAITIHIAFSVFVYLGVRDGKAGMFWLAVGLHTLVNTVGVLAALSPLDITGGLIWLGLSAIACAVLAVYLSKSRGDIRRAAVEVSAVEPEKA